MVDCKFSNCWEFIAFVLMFDFSLFLFHSFVIGLSGVGALVYVFDVVEVVAGFDTPFHLL